MKHLNLELERVENACKIVPSEKESFRFRTHRGTENRRPHMKRSKRSIPFVFAVSGLITLTNGELAIDRDLTILGPGANNLMIQRSLAPGTPDFSIFNVASATVIISGLTVSNGRDAVGGGVYNQGNLTLNDCVISGNFATGG